MANKRRTWSDEETLELIALSVYFGEKGIESNWTELANELNSFFGTERTPKSIETKMYKLKNLSDAAEDSLMDRLEAIDKDVKALKPKSRIAEKNGWYKAEEETVADEIIIEDDDFKASPLSLTEDDIYAYQWHKLTLKEKHNVYVNENKRLAKAKEEPITLKELNEKYSTKKKFSYAQVLELENIVKDIYKSQKIPFVRKEKKIGRNEICPKCDSGKKYKYCCGK